MTKKDYELIAEQIRECVLHDSIEATRHIKHDYQTLRMLTIHLSRALERENPKFDRERFLKACGIQNEVVGINWQDGTSTIKAKNGIVTVPTSNIKD